MEIEKFRFPGEFEPQTDVFINWLPDYCAGEDGDKGREVLVEVVKNLLGHVNVHVNCGCETSLEACKQMLADAGVDVSDPDTEGQRNTAADNGDEKFSPFIRFTQFDDWSVSIRDNGPDVMIDDEGNTLAVNMRWSNYSNNDKMEPAQQLARRAGANMAIDLDVFDMVNSDMVSEGGNREFNGKGVMIAVEDTEVVKRNPEYTKEEIEDEYKRVWNLDKIIWIPKPMLEDDDIRKGPIDKMEDGTLIWPGSFAAHADEYCRFVDEDTVLLAEVTEEEAAEGPISAENKRRIDAAYEILKNETLPDGRPLKIVRMPFPEHLIFRGSQDNPTVMGWKRRRGLRRHPVARGRLLLRQLLQLLQLPRVQRRGVGPALLARGHGSEDQGEGRARQGGAQERVPRPRGRHAGHLLPEPVRRRRALLDQERGNAPIT